MNNLVEYCILYDESSSQASVFNEAQKFTDEIMKNYLWQKESFEIQVNRKSGMTCLSGSTDIGENINDEWFIVYILLEISRKFIDVVIQVTDEDGEFLLIEAADHLPTWLKPEFSINRVFIHQGAIHIIPYPTSPAEITLFPTDTPTLQKAYELVTSDKKTVADQMIQQSVVSRIKGYPTKIIEDFHYSNCYIPEEIVYILFKKPNMVAKAVQAFYERDQLDMKISSTMNSFRPNNCICTRVKFTKHLYSQLVQAHVIPERNSSWKLPPKNDKNYKAAEIGYKLTCGFQMLLSRGQSGMKNEEPAGRLWERYLENLKTKGYFQNELEGSKYYKELLNQAKQHYKETFHVNDGNNQSEIAEELHKLCVESKEHCSETQMLCENLPPEDNDDWMTVTPDELDDIMGKMWNENTDIKPDVDNLSKLVTNMKSFVSNISSYEGAEIPHSTCDDVNNDEHGIEFDEKKFMDTISKLLEPPSNYSVESENEEDDLDGSDREDSLEDPLTRHIMDEMDSELKGTSLPNSFQKSNDADSQSQDDSLNVDYNLVKNFLESFSSQEGMSGPVSNILHSMGMMLPPDDGT